MTYLKWLQSLVGAEDIIVSLNKCNMYTFQFILHVYLNNVEPLEI